MSDTVPGPELSSDEERSPRSPAEQEQQRMRESEPLEWPQPQHKRRAYERHRPPLPLAPQQQQGEGEGEGEGQEDISRLRKDATLQTDALTGQSSSRPYLFKRRPANQPRDTLTNEEVFVRHHVAASLHDLINASIRALSRISYGQTFPDVSDPELYHNLALALRLRCSEFESLVNLHTKLAYRKTTVSRRAASCLEIAKRVASHLDVESQDPSPKDLKHALSNPAINPQDTARELLADWEFFLSTSFDPAETRQLLRRIPIVSFNGSLWRLILLLQDRQGVQQPWVLEGIENYHPIDTVSTLSLLRKARSENATLVSANNESRKASFDRPFKTINHGAFLCLALFADCLIVQRFSIFAWDSQYAHSIINDQRGRFETWATAFDVLSISTSSFEYRLRHISQFRLLVLDVLDMLMGSLYDMRRFLLSPESTAESRVTKQRKLWLDSAYPGLDNSATSIRFASIVYSIHTANDRLLRISDALYFATSAGDEPHADGFDWHDNQGNDIGGPYLRDDLVPFLRYWFPRLRGRIRSRLINASFSRRKSLTESRDFWRYQIDFRDEARDMTPKFSSLPQDEDEDEDVDDDLSSLVSSSERKGKQTGSKTDGELKADIGARALKPFRVSEATRQRFPEPKRKLPCIRCPVCPVWWYRRCREQVWEEHVLRELAPFVCLFGACERSEEMFDTIEDWLYHMRYEHKYEWRCSSRAHSPLSFRNEDDFKLHLRSSHNDLISSSELQDITDASKRALGRGFTRCPFCDQFDKSPQVDPDALLAHIADHLVFIALRSFPEDDALSHASMSTLGSYSETAVEPKMHSGHELVYEQRLDFTWLGNQGYWQGVAQHKVVEQWDRCEKWLNHLQDTLLEASIPPEVALNDTERDLVAQVVAVVIAGSETTIEFSYVADAERMFGFLATATQSLGVLLFIEDSVRSTLLTMAETNSPLKQPDDNEHAVRLAGAVARWLPHTWPILRRKFEMLEECFLFINRIFNGRGIHSSVTAGGRRRLDLTSSGSLTEFLVTVFREIILDSDSGPSLSLKSIMDLSPAFAQAFEENRTLCADTLEEIYQYG